MEKIQIPKGTFDILPYGTKETWRLSRLWQVVEDICTQTAKEYGYKEIRTPIYEKTELFDRGMGATSDVVSKEMFTFLDRGGRSVSLRPEGTASVMRSFLENHLDQLGSVHKLFYLGPMFRYERPQSGRYRQHHQFGVEAIGVAHPEQDAEVIDLLYHIYRRLGIVNITVHLNTVGDEESRSNFRTALCEYLKPHFAGLSDDSKVRFEKNPLRILDSKDPRDREFLEGAPSILHYLTHAAQTHFQELCRLLQLLHIPYRIDDRIVRGLDYYSKTVFEFINEDLGAQNTIGAGGRYDGLLATFQGPDLPGIGWALGLERVIQSMPRREELLVQEMRPWVYFIPLGARAREKSLALVTLCRHHRICADIELHAKKLDNALHHAARMRAHYCAIIGDDELHKEVVQLKCLDSREQREVGFDALVSYLKEAIHG